MMLAQILRYLDPDSEFSYSGEITTETEYDENVKFDKGTKPTWAEVEAARPAVEKLEAQKTIDALRLAAYQTESDPLFFEWQRGEGTEKAWTDKVAEIRARYPYPA